MTADNHERVVAGRAAVKAGDIDDNAESGDLPTGFADALANIMHAAKSDGVNFDRALDNAREHFDAEYEGG